MPSQVKIDKVEKLKQRLADAEAAVFADFRGLTVADANELRGELAEAQAGFAVVKNSLARIAVKEAQLDGVEPFIDGPTAIAFMKGDMVAATKKLVDAAKRFPVLEVRGGWAEGRVLTAEDVRSLAALESREVMLAKIAGLAKAEMSRAAAIFQALQSKFLGLLEAYKEKVPAGDAPAEAPAAETEPDASPSSEPGTEKSPDEVDPGEPGATEEGVADAAAGAEAGDTPGEEAAPEGAPAGEENQSPGEGDGEGEGGS